MLTAILIILLVLTLILFISLAVGYSWLLSPSVTTFEPDEHVWIHDFNDAHCLDNELTYSGHGIANPIHRRACYTSPWYISWYGMANDRVQQVA